MIAHSPGESGFERVNAWLVTGAAGFVGSHLIQRLLFLNQRVTGLDNLATGYRHNLTFVRDEVGEEAWKRFTFVEADVRDFDACSRAVSGLDYVLHQAALGSVPRSMANPHETHTANVDGTVNVLLSAREAGVKKIVYASSSSVYGDNAGLPKVEEESGRPLSPYALSKQIGEMYADAFGRTHGLSAVGLRYFNVVGTRQDPLGPYAAAIPKWVAAFRGGERPVIFGDGETSRDFCPVANVVQANILAALSNETTNGQVYNVALGGKTTLNELFYMLREGLVAEGVDCAHIEPIYEDFRPGDIRHSLADISRAKADFGYAPEVTLEEGLRLVVAE